MEQDPSPSQLGLPPIDQVGYVVEDLDASIRRFGPLFGAFKVMDSSLTGALYRGVPTDVTLRIAFGRSGPIEIELIEFVSGDSPHRAWLEAHGESLMHLRFKVDDIEPYVNGLTELGYENVWNHRMPEMPSIAWAYMQAPKNQGAHYYELVQGL